MFPCVDGKWPVFSEPPFQTINGRPPTLAFWRGTPAIDGLQPSTKDTRNSFATTRTTHDSIAHRSLSTGNQPTRLVRQPSAVWLPIPTGSRTPSAGCLTGGCFRRTTRGNARPNRRLECRETENPRAVAVGWRADARRQWAGGSPFPCLESSLASNPLAGRVARIPSIVPMRDETTSWTARRPTSAADSIPSWT